MEEQEHHNKCSACNMNDLFMGLHGACVFFFNYFFYASHAYAYACLGNSFIYCLLASLLSCTKWSCMFVTFIKECLILYMYMYMFTAILGFPVLCEWVAPLSVQKPDTAPAQHSARPAAATESRRAHDEKQPMTPPCSFEGPATARARL